MSRWLRAILMLLPQLHLLVAGVAVHVRQAVSRRGLWLARVNNRRLLRLARLI